MIKKSDKQKQAVRLMNDYNRILLVGGSRSGKTFIIIRQIFLRAIKEKSRHAILRYRFNHAKVSLWYDTMNKVSELMGIKEFIQQNKSDWFYEFPNGSTVWLGGLDDKDRTEKILGNEYSTIFFNEISQMSYDSVTTALTRLAEPSGLKKKAFFDCNPPAPTHWSYKYFIDGVDPSSGRQTGGKYLYINPFDNLDNIDKDYLETLEALPERKRKRFMFGLWVADVDGSLWKDAIIENNRIYRQPEIVKSVLAIDPAVTSNKNSDETGIIHAGVDREGIAYVLNDMSGIYSPNEWVNKVVNYYRDNEVNSVVIETNQGGDMLKTMIHNVDNSVYIETVRASTGKVLRAEPVVSLYEQGRVKHVGILAKLEEQMTTWDAGAGEKSPDRIDALVYAITNLILKKDRLKIYRSK